MTLNKMPDGVKPITPHETVNNTAKAWGYHLAMEVV